jgi:hypothetical protein
MTHYSTNILLLIINSFKKTWKEWSRIRDFFSFFNTCIEKINSIYMLNKILYDDFSLDLSKINKHKTKTWFKSFYLILFLLLLEKW